MESSSGPREGRPHKGHHTVEFSGGPAIRTWCVHCHGLGLIPGRGTKIPTSSMAKKKRICCWIGLFFRADVGRLINDKAGHLQTGLGLQKGHRWLLIRLSLGGRWGLVEAVPSEPNPPRPFTSGGLKLSRAASPRARALLVQSVELAAPNDPPD